MPSRLKRLFETFKLMAIDRPTIIIPLLVLSWVKLLLHEHADSSDIGVLYHIHRAIEK